MEIGINSWNVPVGQGLGQFSPAAIPYEREKREKQSQLNLGAHKSKIREAEMGRGRSFSSPYPTLQGSYEVGQAWADANLATVHRAEGGKDLCLP